MHVMVVATSFGKDRTVGSIRMTSLVRFLRDAGRQITVVTSKKDYAMPDEFKDVQFIYVDSVNYDKGALGNQQVFLENQSRYSSAFQRYVDQKKPDCVVISGSDFCTFSISTAAAEKRIPCILDFRDPWLRDYYSPFDYISPKKILYRALHEKDEREAIESATAVVTVSNSWVNDFKKAYPAYKNKFLLIENGYDEHLISAAALQKGLDRKSTGEQTILLGVFGKLSYYSKKYTKVMLQGLKRASEDYSVLQVGRREEETNVLLSNAGLPSGIIHSTGFLDYLDGVREINKAHAFLIIDGRKGAIGTKIYDYIYLNKPIIYVGPKDSALSQLVQSFEYGRSCSTVTEVVDALDELSKEKPRRLYIPGTIDPTCYSRKRSNEKWLDLINGLSSDGSDSFHLLSH